MVITRLKLTNWSNFTDEDDANARPSSFSGCG